MIYTVKERELCVKRGDMLIYGILYEPEGSDGLQSKSAVICSHILGGTHVNSGKYALELAKHGFVAYAFDYCGGSIDSRSTGKTTESSIKTWAADLSAVIDEIGALDEVDERRVFLFGQSQGGAVSAMVAADRPDDIAGLILLYPAFIIHGLAVDMFGTPENAPEMYRFCHDLGHIYAVDAIEYDFYEHIGDYEGPVLMFQGTADKFEPKRYTDRAAEIFKNIEYEVFEGVAHSFKGEVRQHVIERTVAFITDNGATGDR